MNKYLRFVHALSINWIGQLGVALTTSSFVVFLMLELARLTGLVANAYVGLITYMTLPAIFVIGLILIPIGWRKTRRDTGKRTRELLNERFLASQTERGFFGSRVFMGIAVLTMVNVAFLGLASTRMLVFMDGPQFCGTACHEVMNPEWVTYQQSSHARVKCVSCHVGEGTKAHIDSKISGVRQMISVTFDLLERPIPTPVRDLRPSRETCEKCHWPDKFYGQKLKSIARFQKDENSTPLYNTLSLKIDAGGEEGGIHWHIAEKNRVSYGSVGDEREEMIWVEVRRPDGSDHRFYNRELSDTTTATEAEARTLDCVDCHNRATHIYEDPVDAIDSRIAMGLIDRSLPFIKREALAALTAGYAGQDQAMNAIANRLHGFYKRHYPEVARTRTEAIDKAVSTLQETYRRNIHHQMKITWGTYPSLMGHEGCFRCHNPALTDVDGNEISSDCTMCHSILAYESRDAYAYLQTADSTAADYEMHEYLRREFLKSSGK